MSAKLAILILFLFINTLTQITITSNNQTSITYLPKVLPCVAYQAASCVTCPYNYHINQNQCYLDIKACLTYAINAIGSEVCKECDPKMGVADGQGGCSMMMNSTSFFIQDCRRPVR